MSAAVSQPQELNQLPKKKKEELIRLLRLLEKQLSEANGKLRQREREVANLKKAIKGQEQSDHTGACEVLEMIRDERESEWVDVEESECREQGSAEEQRRDQWAAPERRAPHP